MENKTDKPYSLQDENDLIQEIWDQHFNIQGNFRNGKVPVDEHNCIKDILSKATEELRSYIRLQTSNASKLIDDNAVLEQKVEELRKENEELQTQVSMFQTDRSERIEEMKRINESNKELVEALKGIDQIAHKIDNGELTRLDEVSSLIGAYSSMSLINKSEGDVNKKI